MRPTRNLDQFNEGQRQALDSLRNLAVRANAGSGKTKVLVERTVQLLARSWDQSAAAGHQPGQEPLKLAAIVAITFTRKAAAELQEKLRSSFVDMARATSDDRERAYWTQCIADLPRAPIGTIDSFCARILREFGLDDPSEPRIEPDYEPLEDYEAFILRKEAIDRVINRLSSLPASERDADLCTRAEACRWWAEHEGYLALVRYLAHLLNHIVEPETISAAHQGKSVPVRLDELWTMLPAVHHLRDNWEALLIALRNLVADIADVKKPGQMLRELDERVLGVLELLRTPGRDNEAKALTALRKSLLTDKGKPRSLGLKEVVQHVKPLQDTWEPLLNDFAFDEAGERCALEAADRLALLLGPVHAQYLALCREVNRYDFLTIARRTRDLLHNSASVRATLRERYRYVLIDEFQDTNQLQWEIISWIVGQGPDGLLDADRLFIVGDPQQSIYRFRQADVGVFDRTQKQIIAANRQHGHAARPTLYDDHAGKPTSTEDQRLGLMPLEVNYRSLAPIPLLLMDRVFQHVFDPDKQGFDLKRMRFEVAYQPFRPGVSADAKGEVRYVVASKRGVRGQGSGVSIQDAASLTPRAHAPSPLTPGDQTPISSQDDDETELAEAADDEEQVEEDLDQVQVQAVIDQLVMLHGQPKYLTDDGKPGVLGWGDMAILLPSRATVLTRLEKELTRRRVPFVVSSGIGFWQRQEVRDVVSLAAWLADAGDELALFAILRGPLGQLSDTEILFLSQLGLGSLNRGLRHIEQVEETLSASASTDARADSHGGVEGPRVRRGGGTITSQQDFTTSPPHHLTTSPPRETVLEDYWRGLSAEDRQRLRSMALRLRNWHWRVDRMAHADLLQRSLEDSGAYAIYAAEIEGEQALANLERLFTIIHDQEARTTPGLTRLARWLRDQVAGFPKEEQAALATGRDAIQLMTVHAAKGLEFPVVAVMKVERMADWVPHSRLLVKNAWDDLLREDAEGLPPIAVGTVAVTIRHPNSPRTMFVPRLLKALRKLNKAQQRAESRRLFYVAATRAKERLILAGKDSDSGRALPPVTWQGWFEGALELTDEHKRDKLWEADGFKVSIITDAVEVETPAQPLTPVAAGQLHLGMIHERPHRPMIATTGLEKMREVWRSNRQEWWLTYRVQLRPHIKLPDLGLAGNVFVADGETMGMAVGTLVHRLFEVDEALRRQPADSRRQLLRAMASSLLSAAVLGVAQDDEGSAPSAADAAIGTVVTVVEDILQRLHNSGNQGSDVRRFLESKGEPEVDFVLDLGKWRITGRFDKLLELPGGCEIVDWKTDASGTPAQITARHLPQMQLYALALYRAGRHVLVDGTVRVHLAMLHHLHVETLRFTAGELEEFARRVVAELEEMDQYALG